MEVENSTQFLSADHYCLATKFIDETLLNAVGHSDGVRQVSIVAQKTQNKSPFSLSDGVGITQQVVLLTDGMDTRPYRLRWPSSTLIFEISPTKVFNVASQKLEGEYQTFWMHEMLFFGFPLNQDHNG